MVEFKDLAGLSKPLSRLVEVMAKGVGAIFRPFLIRKHANAKAYEIKTIAKAIAESQKLLGPIKYQDGAVDVDSDVSIKPSSLPEATPEQRTVARLAFQEARRQSNIESISLCAADELRGETSVPEERPGADWITRFFRIAEDIASEEMQVLWGKVLAGEVRQPGSYSLRTIDLLRNITKSEAEVFVKVGRYAIKTGKQAFLPNPDEGEYLKKALDLTFSDFLMLREIGLLVPTDLSLSIEKMDADDEDRFLFGDTLVIVERKGGTPNQVINVILYSEIGKELLQLVEETRTPDSYIRKFASLYKCEGVRVRAARRIKQADGSVQYEELREVPDD